MSRAHLHVIDEAEAPTPGKPINKWELLRELSKSQTAFGVTERDLTVLQGLLSFFPNDTLDGNSDMVVFPSNKTICERLNGMPCSTMRRHLARLVNAGLVTRRDSPNGKRYVRKYGGERVAFGFDLSPLYRRSEEIVRSAEAVREAEGRSRRLREIVSLMRRDLAALAEFGGEMQPGLGLWDQARDAAILAARALRRKLSPQELGQYRAQLEVLLEQARNAIDGTDTEELVTTGDRIERHHQSSDKESKDLEPNSGRAQLAVVTEDNDPNILEEELDEPGTSSVPRIPLHLINVACPSLKTFYQGEVRHWHQLYDAASHVRAAMGISASAWEEAQRCMGLAQASVVVVAILERFADIRSPGGYLRALSAKAAGGTFSCGPMVMALLGRRRAT